jgi:glycosyltransferase involved in cell wall biosynthesis
MRVAATIPVLFTHYGDEWFRGSEQLLLDLMKNLDRNRFEPILWCNSIAMADAGRLAGITTYSAPFEFYFDYNSPRFSLSRYRSLVRQGVSIVRRHNVLVLHANSAAPNQWLVPVARGNQLPLLTHLHIDYLRRGRYTLLLHQADLVVGVSEQVVQSLRHDGMAASRVKVIYNGIDFNRLTERPAAELRTTLGVPADAMLVGAAGSLIPRKGYDLLLRALGRLSGTPPHLVIAGSGPEEAALRDLTVDLGLVDRVHFLGYRRDVADLYASCDIFAGPSRAESFGLVFAEAGYFRRAVVATRVGGIPEVVADGETGLLVPAGDIDAFAAALGRLAADRDLRQRLGEAGRRRAETRFSAPRMASDFAAEYVRLAGLPRAGLGWDSLPGRATPYFRMLKPRGSAVPVKP